jgi:hypothetical protein
MITISGLIIIKYFFYEIYYKEILSNHKLDDEVSVL